MSDARGREEARRREAALAAGQVVVETIMCKLLAGLGDRSHPRLTWFHSHVLNALDSQLTTERQPEMVFGPSQFRYYQRPGAPLDPGMGDDPHPAVRPEDACTSCRREYEDGDAMELSIRPGAFFVDNRPRATVALPLAPEIGLLASLISLQIRDIPITHLPAEIGRLTRLRRLVVVSCDLVQLPDEVCDLANLRELGVINCPLTELPEDVGRLVNLRSLTARGGRLRQLPASVGQLTGLWTLDVGINQLTDLPDMTRVPQLHLVDVTNNQLTRLPDWLAQHAGSSRLTVSCARNPLEATPDRIGRLQHAVDDMGVIYRRPACQPAARPATQPATQPATRSEEPDDELFAFFDSRIRAAP